MELQLYVISIQRHSALSDGVHVDEMCTHVPEIAAIVEKGTVVCLCGAGNSVYLVARVADRSMRTGSRWRCSRGCSHTGWRRG